MDDRLVVIIADHDPKRRELRCGALAEHYLAVPCASPVELFALLAHDEVGVVLLDLAFPDGPAP